MDAKKFGTFLAATRKEKKMTQAQLAEKIEVTDKAVSRWERGLGFPDITTMEPLADALGISLLELMRSEKLNEDIKKEQYSAKEVSEMLISVTEMNRQQGLQDKRANILAVIVLVIAAALAWLSGKCNLGGALFFGGIAAACGISGYYLWVNRADAQSRRIYGSIFGGLLICVVYLCGLLLPEAGDVAHMRFFRTVICYFWILVVSAASFHSIQTFEKEKKAGGLVTGIVGLLVIFGILWYFSGVFASL